MNLKQSLELFGIVNIIEENEQSLKKLYKKLMIKYHPDNYNGDDNKAKDISMAYKIVCSAIKRINTLDKSSGVSRDSIVINLSDLIRIYKDKKLEFTSNTDYNKKKVISIGDLHNNNVIIIIDWTVLVNGIEMNLSNVCMWNSTDKYQVSCDIFVEDINEECSIKIDVLDRKKEYSIKGQSIRLNLVLDYNINIEMLISKKIKSGE